MALPGYADLIDDLLSTTDPSASAVGQEADEALSERVDPFETVATGSVDELQRQLEDGFVAVNHRDPTSGRAILHEACVSGNLQIVKLLVQHSQIDLMLRTMLGRCTPLHLAVANNHRAVAFMLLSHGADAFSRDRFGCSPMHYAKSLTVAKLLVQYGAKVLDYNSKKKSALESVEAQDEEVVDPATEEGVRCTEARLELIKYLRSQTEIEFKAKLELLRQMRKAQPKRSTQSRRKARPNGANAKRAATKG